MTIKNRLTQLEKRRDNTDFEQRIKVIEVFSTREDGTSYLLSRQTLNEKTGEYITTFDHKQAVDNDNE